MQTTLFILQVIVSVLLLGGILLQPNGSGLGTSFGGGGGANYHTRRGLEKVVFITTIVAAVLFTVVSVALLFTSRS